MLYLDCRGKEKLTNKAEVVNGKQSNKGKPDLPERERMIYKLTRSELRQRKASDFKEGDIIKTGIYYVHIHYKSKDGKYKYDKPSLCSYHEREDFKPCGCTPGADRPYYIDDFINR